MMSRFLGQKSHFGPVCMGLQVLAHCSWRVFLACTFPNTSQASSEQLSFPAASEISAL